MHALEQGRPTHRAHNSCTPQSEHELDLLFVRTWIAHHKLHHCKVKKVLISNLCLWFDVGADSGTDLDGSEGSPKGHASPEMEPNLGRMRSGAKIDIPATTPGRMITAVTRTLWEDLVSNPKKESRKGDHVNRKKVESAEKMIRGAFVELYKGLSLLKTYRLSINPIIFFSWFNLHYYIANLLLTFFHHCSWFLWSKSNLLYDMIMLINNS